MEKNKTGKYLKFAIGEIMLVMIGILLALQVSNWNEQGKLKGQEIEILKGIRQDLVNDTIDIDYNIRAYKSYINKDSLLISHIYNKKEKYNRFSIDFDNSIRADWGIILHNSYYEELKTKGLSLISNRQLKERNSRLYQFDYPYLESSESNTYNNHRALTIELDKYLKTDSTGLVMDSQTYNKLLSDGHAHYILEESIYIKKRLLNKYYKILLQNNELRDLIDSEIEHLE